MFHETHIVLDIIQLVRTPFTAHYVSIRLQRDKSITDLEGVVIKITTGSTYFQSILYHNVVYTLGSDAIRVVYPDVTPEDTQTVYVAMVQHRHRAHVCGISLSLEEAKRILRIYLDKTTENVDKAIVVETLLDSTYEDDSLWNEEHVYTV